MCPLQPSCYLRQHNARQTSSRCGQADPITFYHATFTPGLTCVFAYVDNVSRYIFHLHRRCKWSQSVVTSLQAEHTSSWLFVEEIKMSMNVLSSSGDMMGPLAMCLWCWGPQICGSLISYSSYQSLVFYWSWSLPPLLNATAWFVLSCWSQLSIKIHFFLHGLHSLYSIR